MSDSKSSLVGGECADHLGPCDSTCRQALLELLNQSGDWLVQRLLDYAKRQGFNRYTSALAEAWRLVVTGMTASLCAALHDMGRIPEVRADASPVDDALTRFGVVEAQRHRQRGVSLVMFLGLMKCVRRSYVDLVCLRAAPEHGRWQRQFVERSFDRIEIALCESWTRVDTETNVAELQAAARLMANEKTAYLTVFESLSDPVIMLDEHDAILNLNHAAAKLVCPDELPGAGYYRLEDPIKALVAEPGVTCSHASFVGQRLIAVFPWLSGALECLRSAGTAAPHCEVEAEIRGDVHQYDVQVAAMLDLTEKFTATILTLRDVTAARRAEEERLELERRILQAQKMESLGALAGGIAHDFNNLLVGVIGNAELALDSLPPGTPARSRIEGILRSGQRAAKLTQQMLAYSGRGHFFLQRIDLAALVKKMSSTLARTVPRTVELRYECPAGLPAIDADESQIRQAIANLVTNAVEAIGAAGGHITVRLGAGSVGFDEPEAAEGTEDPAESRVFLEVSDDGCGMDADTLARMFDPFFSTKFIGRGLGLPVVQGIVRGHKGRLQARSVLGRGTTIRMSFPAAAAAVAGDAVAGRKAATAGPRATVLVVDDEPEVHEVVKAWLVDAGLDVVSAQDGPQAIECVRQRSQDIDCVVLEMTMPRMNGIACGDTLRELCPTLPILLTSGYSEADLAKDLAGHSLTGFVQKPYRRAELVARVRAALQAGRGAAALHRAR
jgi:signal transduction histidine kinase/PAS domain-containing protein/ActR/RegA family two-component response regulator